MKRLLILALAAGIAVCAADAPRIKRSALQALERSLDVMLLSSSDPCELLGNTRGIYLDNYGAVFTALANLVYTPTPNPFRPKISPAELRALHDRKLVKLEALKNQMREALVTLAADPALDSVRPNEQIVCGVSLFYYSWEDVKGLPAQMIVQGEKQKLLEVEKGSTPKSGLATIVKVQELF